MNLYLATAVKPCGNATAAFLIAFDSDDAVAIASKRLVLQHGNEAKITHCLKVCQASPAILERSGCKRRSKPLALESEVRVKP